MAAESQKPWRKGTRRPESEEPLQCVGQQLAEPGKFAYAALWGISLASLFPGPEDSSYRTEVIERLVKWLELSEAVLPAMLAFAGGLGGEGTDTFVQILLKEPALSENPKNITQDLVAFSLKDGSYDARLRVLLAHVTWLLRIPPVELEAAEERLLECLNEEEEEESETAEASRKKKERRRRLKRYLLIGLATVGGGTVIGLTGGLAAPLVAAGAAAIIGSAGAAALGSVAGIAVMASLFGAAGAGLTGYKMKKRVGAIEEFEFLPLTEGKQLHITVAITGWLSTGKFGSFTAPWSSLLHSKEQYCLAWESKYLMELGNALDSLWNGLVNMVAQEALKYTVLAGIVTALTWPASLLTVASVIDNPWGVCLHRSAEVGKHLAQILLSRQQGRRPVTLIGFSLGARVIYFCLREMAKEKDCKGIIEDVVLLGAPVEGDAKSWKPFTKVVAGKIINGYCRGDWLLSFVYRTSSVQLSVAGLQPVTLDDRRMVNVDLSSVVSGHLDYMKQMDTILKAVGVKTKQCRLEEGGTLAVLSNKTAESQAVALHDDAPAEPSMRQEEDEDTVHIAPWSWEPVPSQELCPGDSAQGLGSELRENSQAQEQQNRPGQEEPFTTDASDSSHHSQTTDHATCAIDPLSPSSR
ncbi:PREDICTED: transmembrane and coiled-coil domain-containing protein 4 [Gekko japonicus]|uniref:Transmembrane and coiled-coil domain-containing protein 4 n=1 Tax=Gekko japonicus TaxID=146911 RepID=A0ABM1K304_GEKJA|nr:PREDICTED: transmembrane and coiled-coil domain-containing protein 4 [Gekko japonicus]